MEYFPKVVALPPRAAEEAMGILVDYSLPNNFIDRRNFVPQPSCAGEDNRVYGGSNVGRMVSVTEQRHGTLSDTLPFDRSVFGVPTNGLRARSRDWPRLWYLAPRNACVC